MSDIMIKFGAAGGHDIIAAIPPGGLDSMSLLTLSLDYGREPPLGYPDPNHGVEAGTSFTNSPRIIPAGATFKTFTAEAAALIAAGAAFMPDIAVKFGVADDRDIIAAIPPGGQDSMSAITLSLDYDRGPPLGYPDPPGVEDGTSFTFSPGIIPAGATFKTFTAEAAALVAAGAATYA